MTTKIYTTEHTLNGRAVVKAFTEKAAALGYAREVVGNPDASVVSLWEYATAQQARTCLALCFEKAEWWETRVGLGCVDKIGRFLADRSRRKPRAEPGASPDGR